MHGEVILRRDDDVMVIKWDDGNTYWVIRLDVTPGEVGHFAKVIREDNGTWSLYYGPEFGEYTNGLWWCAGTGYHDWDTPVDKAFTVLKLTRENEKRRAEQRLPLWKKIINRWLKRS